MQEPTLAEVRPGTIIFGPIGGIVPGFFPVGVGQMLLKASSPETFKIRHVLVCVESAGGGHGPKAVQAMPHGAEEIELTAQHWTSAYAYVMPNYGISTHTSLLGMAVGQGYDVAREARALVGTPYSFLDYAALTAHAASGRGYVPLGQRSKLERYVASTKHMICSQLADEAMRRAGFHVFNDGRLPQDVMPAALFTGLQKLGPKSVIIPS